jgi:AraC-like DNA-binding protein
MESIKENINKLKLHIKYMMSSRCKTIVKEELKKLGLHYVMVDMGVVELMEDITDEQRHLIKTALFESGLELMDDKKALLIDKIKNAIVEMIHQTDEMPRVNFSDFISDKLKHDYTYLANIFSDIQGTTIENYIILHKIERVKELIIYDELNLTEIAYKLHYSSVAHLSNQFKKVTGLTPSHFKSLKVKRQIAIEDTLN